MNVVDNGTFRLCTLNMATLSMQTHLMQSQHETP